MSLLTSSRLILVVRLDIGRFQERMASGPIKRVNHVFWNDVKNVVDGKSTIQSKDEKIKNELRNAYDDAEDILQEMKQIMSRSIEKHQKEIEQAAGKRPLPTGGRNIRKQC